MANISVITILLALLVLVLVGVLVALSVIIINQKRNASSANNPIKEQAPEINIEDVLSKLPQQAQRKNISPSKANLQHCHYHRKERAVEKCAICSSFLCSNCTSENNENTFCETHYHSFKDESWVELVSAEVDSENSKEALFLVDYKEKIWEEQSIPSLVNTHYRINFETNKIESSFTLSVREFDLEKLAQDLKYQDFFVSKNYFINRNVRDLLQ